MMETPGTADVDDQMTARIESIKRRVESLIKKLDQFVTIEYSLKFREQDMDSLDSIRYFLLDVCSTIDYVYNVLYQLFSSTGERRVGFPYKPKGVKVQQDSNHRHHDERERFLTGILRDWDKLTTKQRNKIADIFLSVQPTQMVDGGGAPIGEIQYQPYYKEVYAILHCLRNWEAHNGSVHVYSKISFIEVCPRERTIRLVPVDQRRNNGSCIHMALDIQLLWIRMPKSLPPSLDNRDRPLIPLIDQFLMVVARITDDLLHSTNLHVFSRDKTIWKQVCVQ